MDGQFAVRGAPSATRAGTHSYIFGQRCPNGLEEAYLMSILRPRIAAGRIGANGRAEDRVTPWPPNGAFDAGSTAKAPGQEEQVFALHADRFSLT
jgi:hypothetical protein